MVKDFALDMLQSGEASSRAASKHHNSDFRNGPSFVRDIARDVLIHGSVDWRLGALCTLDAEGGFKVDRRCMATTPNSPEARRDGCPEAIKAVLESYSRGLHIFTVTGIDSGGNQNLNAVIYDEAED